MKNWLFLLLLFSSMFNTTKAFCAEPISSLKGGGEKKYLVINTRAGLGNRLGAMASAYAVARLTGRVLVLHWDVIVENEMGEGEMPALFEQLFANEVVKLSDLIDDEKNQHLSDELLDNFTKPDPRNFCQWLCGRPRAGDDRILVIRGGFGQFVRAFRLNSAVDLDTDIVERIRNSDAEMVYLTFFIRDFIGPVINGNVSLPATKMALVRYYHEFFSKLQPVKPVQRLVEALLKPFSQESDFLIGVHYRSFSAQVGDDKIYNLEGYRPTAIEAFVDKISPLIDLVRRQKLNPRVILATDDPVAEKEFRRLLPNDVKIITSKTPISRRDLQGQLGGLLDWELLRKTNIVVGTNQSTFSDVAAVTTKTGSKIKVGPLVYAQQSQEFFASVVYTKLYQDYVQSLAYKKKYQ